MAQFAPIVRLQIIQGVGKMSFLSVCYVPALAEGILYLSKRVKLCALSFVFLFISNSDLLANVSSDSTTNYSQQTLHPQEKVELITVKLREIEDAVTAVDVKIEILEGIISESIILFQALEQRITSAREQNKDLVVYELEAVMTEVNNSTDAINEKLTLHYDNREDLAYNYQELRTELNYYLYVLNHSEQPFDDSQFDDIAFTSKH